jgi:hypothetical protein
MQMEQTECSEMLAYKIQVLGNYPEESMQISVVLIVFLQGQNILQNGINFLFANLFHCHNI